MHSGYCFVLIMCAAVLPSAFAISCYECNSKEFPACEKLDVHPAALAGVYRECPKNLGAEVFCRKVDVTIIDGGVHRVTRSCGWEKSPRNCYFADNDDHFETVCQCFEDGCNGAPKSLTNANYLLSSVGLMVIYLVSIYYKF